MWYVLRCREGQEETIIRSCRQHLSKEACDEVFSFRCERLWRRDGVWKLMEKEMFPGYVFVESHQPGLLSRELDQYRSILRVMEEDGYLISVYEDEEKSLRELCGDRHYLKMSYGYKENGVDHITKGPLKEAGSRIIRIDWHRRFAQLEFTVAKKRAIVWAGVGLDESVLERDEAGSGKLLSTAV